MFMPETTDPVPVDVLAVIELFATHLAKVAFPDVDAASLRKQADELRAESTNVARARDALAAAVAVSEARLAKLTDSCARAIAYARIYSEANPQRQPIAEAIAALTETAAKEAPATRTGKRRGRPPRQTGELFETAEPPT
jgi:hypothetical protein